ncbi:MAG: O-antigen ligase family protein [Candidatus Scalindua sediminis]|nr:O-antigen ligase family protein [Candidatus Scalindua sediminis]
MSKNKEHKHGSIEIRPDESRQRRIWGLLQGRPQATTFGTTGLTSRCDQIIIFLLLVIIFAVPLFCGVPLFGGSIYSVFDLSKITILYILGFTTLAIWSIKTIIICWTRPTPERHGRAGELQGAGGQEDVPARTLPDRWQAGMSGWWSGLLGNIHSHKAGLSPPYRLAQPLNLPIIAFLFVSALATFFSINPYISLVGTYKRYDGLISTLVYVFLFYAIVNFIQRRRLNLLLNVIILTACIASVYGILQHFGLDLYQWSTSFGYGIRVSATFGHPVFFSAFLIMVIPLVLIKIFWGRGSFKAYLYVGILALLLITFYYTKTRASFLGLIASNLFFFFLIGRKTLLANKAKTIVTLTVLVGISLFYNMNDKTSVTGRFIQDIKPIISEGDAGFAPQLKGTPRMRVFQYITGLDIIHDYPILGIGPDTLGLIYPQYLAKVYKEKEEHGGFQNQNRIHNDFLDVTVSRGLLGLGVYLWFIFAYSRMVWKGYKKAKGLDKILIIGICSSCLSYFIQNQFSFGHIPIITLFWFLIGISVIACHQTNPPERSRADGQIFTKWFNNPTLERSVKTIACGLIICLMILLITFSLFFYKADMYFYKGRKFLNKNSMIEAMGSYEMAVKYNPLEINYLNVLNNVYLKMAAISLNKKGNNIPPAFLHRGGESRGSRGTLRKQEVGGMEKDLAGFSTPARQSRSGGQEQATMWWLTNTIIGAMELQRLYPKDYRSAFTLGQAYHLLDGISNEDMSKDAIKYYKRAITLHPFMFKLRDKLAQIYVEKGHYQEAIQELKEAIRITPGNPVPYINLTNILIKLGRHEDARKTCNRILELTGSASSKYNEYAKNKLEFLSKSQATETTNTSGAREKGDSPGVRQ